MMLAGDDDGGDDGGGDDDGDDDDGKPADLGLRYDAGRKSAEEAGPVIQGGEDPDPVTRCVHNHYKSDILTHICLLSGREERR